MYLTLSLIALTALSLFTLSKIADYFLAKRPEIKWILLASLGSAFIAFISYIGLTFIIAGIDLSAAGQSQTLINSHPTVILVVSAIIMLLLSSVAFKSINQMCWPSAITTNFVSLAITTIVLASTFSSNDNRTEKLVTAKTAPVEKAIDKSKSIVNLVKP